MQEVVGHVVVVIYLAALRKKTKGEYVIVTRKNPGTAT
jgi:hypothetical protein